MQEQVEQSIAELEQAEQAMLTTIHASEQWQQLVSIRGALSVLRSLKERATTPQEASQAPIDNET